MTSDELATIMNYHLLPQIVYSTGLTNATKFLTQQGENISVLHSGNNVYINSAQLLQTDILIANGVLHVIDNVLNPQGPGAQPNPALATQVPAFASASSVDYLPYTSALPCTVSCPVSSTSGKSESVTSSKGAGATSASAATTSQSSSSSKALGAAMARETGFGAAGLMVALGGAVMLI
jgi:transforming growth factor-beta-induced protein